MVSLTPRERRARNREICETRARGATIRALAAEHGLSKSMIFKIVVEVELLPPPPRIWSELVHHENGGLGPVYHVSHPKGRAFRMSEGRRVYPSP